MVQFFVAVVSAIGGGVMLLALLNAIREKQPIGPPAVLLLVAIAVGAGMWHLRPKEPPFEATWPWVTIYLLSFAIFSAILLIPTEKKTTRPRVTMTRRHD